MSVNIDDMGTNCLTIGRQAPDFTTLSTDGVITLSQFRGKWVLLFSEPAGFTSTSTVSLVELSRMHEEFEKRNVQILLLSLDNNYANISWLNDIHDFYGIIVPFPVLEDRDKVIAESYHIVNPDRIYEESVRDLFIINPSGGIKAIMTYPVSVGRNYYEILRIIDSLQLTETYGVYTPPNWMPGNPVMIPAVSTFREALQLKEKGHEMGLNCVTFYNCFKDYNSLGSPIQENIN